MACGTPAPRHGMSVGGPCVLSGPSLAETSMAAAVSSSSLCAAASRRWSWRTESLLIWWRMGGSCSVYGPVEFW